MRLAMLLLLVAFPARAQAPVLAGDVVRVEAVADPGGGSCCTACNYSPRRCRSCRWRHRIDPARRREPHSDPARLHRMRAPTPRGRTDEGVAGVGNVGDRDRGDGAGDGGPVVSVWGDPVVLHPSALRCGTGSPDALHKAGPQSPMRTVGALPDEYAVTDPKAPDRARVATPNVDGAMVDGDDRAAEVVVIATRDVGEIRGGLAVVVALDGTSNGRRDPSVWLKRRRPLGRKLACLSPAFTLATFAR